MAVEWKTHYRRLAVDRYAYGKSGIVVEKSTRVWNYWFYLSLCDNAMCCQHKLNNQHLHLHSLVYLLAGLNENQRLPTQIQELLHII